jgi:hypothetical protein
MKSVILGIATAAALTGGACLAQTTQNTTQGSSPGMTPSATTPNNAAPANGMQNRQSGMQNDQAAASGNNNQAVATTDANAATPAEGANSFTMNQAKSRLETQGFSNVSDLHKDDNGVWRGKAEKNGTTSNVWLDYKGNAGIAQQ